MISRKLLREFWNRHPDAEQWLRQWYKLASQAQWTSLQDVRRDYPHVDGVAVGRGETLTVFNVVGNKYPLITRIRYDYQLVNIRAILPHKAYSQGKWKE